MNNQRYEEVMIDECTNLYGGKSIFYKCLLCCDVVDSEPLNASRCKCSNIRIDADAGRIAIRDFSNSRMLKSMGVRLH